MDQGGSSKGPIWEFWHATTAYFKTWLPEAAESMAPPRVLADSPAPAGRPPDTCPDSCFPPALCCARHRSTYCTRTRSTPPPSVKPRALRSVGKHEHIARGIHSHRDCPHHLVQVKRIHVLIHDDDDPSRSAIAGRIINVRPPARNSASRKKLLHSLRNACNGSMREARRAGT
jgi:hypothetical protein